MLKIRKSYRIGPYDVAVNLKDKVIVDGDEKDGCYDSKTQTIEIRNGVSPQRKQVVLIHELGHAFIDIYNIPLKEDEEHIVESFDHAIVSFLKNNNLCS